MLSSRKEYVINSIILFALDLVIALLTSNSGVSNLLCLNHKTGLQNNYINSQHQSKYGTLYKLSIFQNSEYDIFQLKK